MAARAVKELPIGDDWRYEAKLDGYRVLALKAGERVRLLSRNNRDVKTDARGPEITDLRCPLFSDVLVH
jgi:ATP-dependent DNA ligase